MHLLSLSLSLPLTPSLSLSINLLSGKSALIIVRLKKDERNGTVTLYSVSFSWTV